MILCWDDILGGWFCGSGLEMLMEWNVCVIFVVSVVFF